LLTAIIDISCGYSRLGGTERILASNNDWLKWLAVQLATFFFAKLYSGLLPTERTRQRSGF
jgi:hypothetical protein